MIDDPSPQPKVGDPLLATAAIALVAGAGGKLGEMVIEWLVARIRKIVSKRKAKVTLTVAGVQLTVDEQTKPDQVAAQFGYRFLSPDLTVGRPADLCGWLKRSGL